MLHQNFKTKTTFLFLAVCFSIISCSKKSNTTPATQNPTATITFLSVTQGDYGTQVIMKGTGFDATTKFYFNGKAANTDFTPTSTQQIVYVPVAAGTGAVTAIVNGVTITGPTFTYNKAYCVTNVAGSYSTSGSVDGAGSAASFSNPNSIVLDKLGNLYVSDFGNNKIRKITPDGTVTTFAGTGIAGNADGTLKTATFNGPCGLAFDANDNLIVVDSNNHLIRKIAADGTVTTIAGGGTLASGAAKSVRLFNPYGIAIDLTGNIFISQTGNSTIVKMTPASTITTFAGTAGVAGSQDGTGTAAGLSLPSQITFDKAGNLYVADAGNGSIRKITSQAIVSTIVTNTSLFGYPKGVAVTDNGNIYVTDAKNGLVKLVANNATSNFIGGTIGVPQDGAFDHAVLGFPSGIISDGNGSFYFTDEGLHSIKKISYQ